MTEDKSHHDSLEILNFQCFLIKETVYICTDAFCNKRRIL